MEAPDEPWHVLPAPGVDLLEPAGGGPLHFDDQRRPVQPRPAQLAYEGLVVGLRAHHVRGVVRGPATSTADAEEVRHVALLAPARDDRPPPPGGLGPLHGGDEAVLAEAVDVAAERLLLRAAEDEEDPGRSEAVADM